MSARPAASHSNRSHETRYHRRRRRAALLIGRPWITLAIDVYGWVVAGFYISLDPPGAIAMGRVFAHAVLPKEARLAKLAVTGRWPCFGLPSRIHLDKRQGTRGDAAPGVRAIWNHILVPPVAQPHMGGHIERLLETLLRALHEPRGATFSPTPESAATMIRKRAPL